MATEDDFREAVQTALLATNQFSEVSLIGLPEDWGMEASALTAVAIEPSHTGMLTGWDAAPAGGRNFMCQLLVTILSRHENPVLCDQQAGRLLAYVRKTVDGQPLVAGFNEPQKTMITGWRWLPRKDAERRIAATFTYNYIQDGWANADTSD